MFSSDILPLFVIKVIIPQYLAHCKVLIFGDVFEVSFFSFSWEIFSGRPFEVLISQSRFIYNKFTQFFIHEKSMVTSNFL